MFKPSRILLAAFTCMLVIACQKEVDFNTPVTTGTISSGTFKAKIDGVQFTAETAAGSILRNIIGITAFSKDKKYFVINIADTLPGTYKLSQNSFHVIAFADSTDTNTTAFTTNEGNDSTQAGGSVTITAIDKVNKTIAGSFACKMYRDQDGKQKVITEGSFKVPYTSGLPAAKITDTFSVKIDGTDWKPKSITSLVTAGLLVVNASELNVSKVLGFQFPQSITAGTYDFDFAGQYVGLYLPDGLTSFVADSGKLTILERNISTKRIRGNFNFRASELIGTKSYLMTNGYFSVGY